MVRAMGLAAFGFTLPIAVVATVAWSLVSVNAMSSAAAGAFGAIVFTGIGHLVQWCWASASVQAQLVAALAGYGIRVGLFGGGLALYLARGTTTTLHSTALVTGCLAVVLVGLFAEVWANSRLRILSFDAEPSEEVR